MRYRYAARGTRASPLLNSLLPPLISNHLPDATAAAPLQPLTTLAAFPGMRSLHLDYAGAELLPDALARIAHGLPRLESLRLHFPSPGSLVTNPATALCTLSFWEPLTALRGLRTLVVSQPYSPFVQLDHSVLRFLCSLPLTHLNVADMQLVLAAGGNNSDSPQRQQQFDVAPTLRLLCLPRCCSEAPARCCEMLLDRLATRGGSAERDNEAVEATDCLAGLRYLSLDILHWPANSLTRCLTAVSSSLGSLELRNINQSRFSPSLLLATTGATGRPLLPHLRHLSIGQHEWQLRHDLTVEQADSWTDELAQLLHCNRHQLRQIALYVPVGSSCWPLLQAVFSCSALRRCKLSIEFRQRVPAGGPDFVGVLAAL